MKQELSLTQAHRLLAPRPTCLLTTRYKGQVNVMPLAWTCPVSTEPPLVIMAIHPSRYTHGMLKRSEEGVLNIPGRGLAEHVVKCGRVSGEDTDKLRMTGLTLDTGRRVGSPWIAECLAHLECAIIDQLAAGDHALFLAEIIGAWAEEEAFSGVWLGPADNEELHPLIHLGGNRFCLLGKMVSWP